MEICASTAACVAIPIIYQHIRKRVHVNVNCWFCNKDQKVPFIERNGWTCNDCEQYNGFNEDGDYNRRIHGQNSPLSRNTMKRFCSTPTSRELSHSIGDNGFCDKCNESQEKILEKIRMFEPVNESRWNAELDEYKYKLDQIYPICEKCTMIAQRKIIRDKKQYGHLLSLCRSGTSIMSSMNGKIEKIPHLSRRRWLSGGFYAETFHALSFFLAVLLFMGNYHHLQMDVEDVPSLTEFLPTVCLSILDLIKQYAGYLSIAMFALHGTAFLKNKCRTIFTDLLFFPACAVLVYCASFSSVDPATLEDFEVYQCVFSACLTAIAAATWLIPRKRKHKKKPNTISSAFSVASTPMSQCSSQLSSRNASPSNISMTMGGKGNLLKTPHMPRGIVSPVDIRIKNNDNESQEMEWEPSVIDVPNPLPPKLSSLRENSRFRDATPTREIGCLLGGLQLSRGSSNDVLRRGPFGSLSFNPSVQNHHSETGYTRSWVDTSSQVSAFTSVSQRQPNRFSMNSAFDDRRNNSKEGSVLTSVSQTSLSSSSWSGRILVAFCLFSGFINALLFYFLVFHKKN